MLKNTDLNDLLKKNLSFEMEQIDQLISRILSGKHLIQVISEYLIYSGGKRLRPSLTILVAKMLGYKKDVKHISLAVAIEFIHTATLLHDDVVDESNLRRGKKTSNNIWGNQATILVGDYLLSQAFGLVVKEQNLQILDILSKAASVIAEGEILQLSFLSNFSITEEKYIEIIAAKTAELFAASSSIGAVIAEGKDQMVQNFYDLGMNLGLGFQIMDDILDYSSSSVQMGKESGDDFKEGKITLPILIAYGEGNESDKATLESIFLSESKTMENFEITKKIIDKYSAIEKSLSKARGYIEQSKLYLISYPESQEKSLLLDILDFSLKRIY